MLLRRATYTLSLFAVLFTTGCNVPNLQSLTRGNTPDSAEIPAANTAFADEDPCLVYDDQLQAFDVPEPIEIWPRMRNGFAFPDYADARIAKRLAWYNKRPKHIGTVTQRGELYIHFILEKLDERGLPHELALIPMIESGFDPFAYSYATASGLWQFMPYTGKHLGLEQNWWYDGRRDVTASTEACPHLSFKIK